MQRTHFGSTLGLILFSVGMLLTVSVNAATMIVTSAEDSGENTFRTIVAAANTTTGRDTIIFAVSNSVTVFSDITITDAIIIEGRGTTIGSTGLIDCIPIRLNAGSDGSIVQNLALVSSTSGIRIDSHNNTLAACMLGTDWSGALNRGNTVGATVYGNSNVLGRLAPDHTTIFSGNFNSGISLHGNNCQVINSIIGLNLLGLSELPNDYGIFVYGTGHIIGGTTPTERNIISGNNRQGITLNGSNCRILGNYFGFNMAGNTELENGNNADILTYGSDNYFAVNYASTRFFFTNSNCTGNTLAGNYVGLFPDDLSFTGQTAYNGVSFYNGANNNFIGLPNGNGNFFADTINEAIIIHGTTTLGNSIMGNTLIACSDIPIVFENSAQNGQLPPTITSAVANNLVQGTADPGEYIEVFLAEGNGINDGCIQYLGATTADGTGNWQLSVLAAAGQYVVATATDQSNNTSILSNKLILQAPTPTPTPSTSPTATTTPTMTVTPTVTLTSISTATSTMTVTPTSNLLNLNGKTILAFPNPGKNQVTIGLDLEKSASVEIHIYNLIGEQITKLTAELASGTQTLLWDCSGISPGIYLARVLVDKKEMDTLKIAVVK